MAALQDSIRRIVEALVAKDYAEAVRITRGIRLPEEQIREAIQDYGRTLVMPPDGAFDTLDVVEVTGATPRQWSVRMNLWTEEEGRSDLSIEVTLTEADDGFVVELDDLHVL